MKSRLAEKALQHESRMGKLRGLEAERRQKEELRQQRKNQVSQAENAMDATGWGEWKRSRKEAPIRLPIDPEIRRLKLASQAESMRKLRAHRRRMQDIWRVYKSDMYPRHFRRVNARNFYTLRLPKHSERSSA